MIIEQNSELKVLRLLAGRWFNTFSVYEIAKEAKLTPPTAYKAVEKLLAKHALIKEQKRIRVDLTFLFSYRFKLLYDAERLLLLPPGVQEKAREILRIFQYHYQENLLSFLIFGSMAAGEYTPASDLDILVVVKEKKVMDYRKEGLLNFGEINLIEKDKAEFEREYLLGHDLILASLMKGIVLHDRSFLPFFFAKALPLPSEEIIQQKMVHLEKLKQRAFILLREKDAEEALSYFRRFLLEKARFLLLQKGIIPCSKKEIWEKIKKINKELYLSYNRINKNNLPQIISQNV